MSRVLLTVAGIIVIIAGIVAASALFTVSETQQAIVLQFGEPKRVVKEAGLHVKIPFVQDVAYFDARVLGYAPPAEEIITSDQKRFVADTYARYRIVDPLKFYQSTGTEETFRSTLSNYLTSALRRVIGNRTFASVLSAERADIMADIQGRVNVETDRFGIEVIDVRIRRADLPEANAQAIYSRMQSEREREAREFRAQGAELAQRIRSRAERERTVLLAEARRQAQALRGEGDAEAIRIYAEAFGQDPEFFAFYRSMEAYRNALGPESTTLVLSPDSKFFRYFNDIPGGLDAADEGEPALSAEGGQPPAPASQPPAAGAPAPENPPQARPASPAR